MVRIVDGASRESAPAGSPSLKSRMLAETKAYPFIAGYLWLFLSTLTAYRQLVQMEYGVGYMQYGFSLVEALVLGKLIMIGRMLKLGDRFKDRPLIVPTLYKTLCFSLLVVLFNTTEHVVVGLWHREDAAAIAQRVLGLGKWEILCRVVMMVMVFAPMFATWELGRMVGEGTLFRLFFRRRADPPAGDAKCTM